MNDCAVKQSKKNDDVMIQLYDKQISTLKSGDVKDKLRKSQSAWISYRDSACDYETMPVREGSLAGWVKNLCLADLTEERILRLKGYRNCTSSGCPE